MNPLPCGDTSQGGTAPVDRGCRAKKITVMTNAWQRYRCTKILLRCSLVIGACTEKPPRGALMPGDLSPPFRYAARATLTRAERSARRTAQRTCSTARCVSGAYTLENKNPRSGVDVHFLCAQCFLR